MADIKFYYLNGTCATSVHATLLELGILFKPIEMVRSPNGFVPGDGSMTREDYIEKVHPLGYVPALVVHGQPLTEAIAILSYLASLDPERGLLGKTPWEKAKVQEWLVWLSGTLHSTGYAALWRPSRFTDDEALFDAIKTGAKEKIKYCYGRIEEKIDGTYAVGDHLTVVDFFLNVFWRWGGQGQIGALDASGLDMGRCPRFRELVKNVERFEGLREALRTEKKELEFPDQKL
ncbi:hypothetical protein M409DRAFT_23115 [Zasmidium cellare ATCC 36951]|uniref:Glutathione S-transferase n=1 Tax=Zasmidium cellare ATCC 36951 TaxID=1080233 RepID=A0A6A6CM08_ZASCE|nr:uncharacterized protein M409DRAFT_23115 [Zasmidium cellare ATCC 36951]KAF2166476.1 hypothetical protein M409DRAFT_23115 [Zasmidium cellare ATCC 36951]